MSILRFVSQDQLDDLDDDSHIAFMTIANIAQKSLFDQTRNLDNNEAGDWRLTEELRHSFMNSLLASAKRLDVEPFASMDVPHHTDFNDRIYRGFRDDLEHYITQLVIDNSRKAKKQSVELPSKAKNDIQNYLNNLRDCIKNSNIDANKKTSLLDRLDKFESELGKRRINIGAVSLVLFEILSIPGGLWSSYEIASKLVTNIAQSVADARDEDQPNQKISPPPPMKALSPPRKRPSKNDIQTAMIDKYDLDDDIPF